MKYVLLLFVALIGGKSISAQGESKTKILAIYDMDSVRASLSGYKEARYSCDSHLTVHRFRIDSAVSHLEAYKNETRILKSTYSPQVLASRRQFERENDSAIAVRKKTLTDDSIRLKEAIVVKYDYRIFAAAEELLGASRYFDIVSSEALPSWENLYPGQVYIKVNCTEALIESLKKK